MRKSTKRAFAIIQMKKLFRVAFKGWQRYKRNSLFFSIYFYNELALHKRKEGNFMEKKKGFFEGSFGKFVLPGIILQSVMIGGGYATGREIVEIRRAGLAVRPGDILRICGHRGTDL